MTHTTKLILGISIVLVLGLGVFALTHKPAPVPPPVATSTIPVATPTPTSTISTIGQSVQGRAIRAYTFGTGSTTLLFVGGMHGGYEWNSVVLAYDFIDYFNTNPAAVPKNLTVAIIPDINPDAVYEVTKKEGKITAADVLALSSTDMKAARFNADNVDLNRNFACNWAATSTWQSKTVSAGTAPFSEPEAAALRDYVTKIKPVAVAFWHSAAGAIYGAACNGPEATSTVDLVETYAKAGNYKAVPLFTAYPVTGDSESWLASIGIPAITVEMSSHTSVEWQKNLAGVTAVLNQYEALAK